MVYLLGVAFVASRHGRGAVRGHGPPERRGVRLLLRAAVPDLRGGRHPVPDHVRGDAPGERPDQHARRAGPRPGRRGAAAGAADAGALRDEPGPGGGADGRRRSRGPRRRHVSDVFGGEAAVLVPGPGGRARAGERGAWPATPARGAVAQWAFDHGQTAGLGTDTLPGASAVWVPLRGTQAVLGVLGAAPGPRAPPPAAGPGRPAGGARPAGGLRPRAGAPGRRGAAGSRRGGGGAAAEHAAELRVPRPADAARHDHRRREQLCSRTPRSGMARDGSSRRRSTRRRCASTAS